MTLPTSVVILVPVLRRPQNVARVLASLERSVADERAEGWTVDCVFVATAGDTEEIEAIKASWADSIVVPWPAGPGDFARKINAGAQTTEHDWIFTGADDLDFRPGWLRACISTHVRTGALVIGTNDLHNPTVTKGQYATHLLVHRSYFDRAVIDEPGNVLCEKYDHNCVDTELVDTARYHGVYASATHAHVEHLHPVWRLSPYDDVYRKGKEHHARDRRLYMRRRHLWTRRVSRLRTRPAPVSRWPGRG